MLIAKVMQAAGNDVRVLCRSDRSFDLPHKWGISTGLAVDKKDDCYDLVVEATGNIEGPRLTS